MTVVDIEALSGAVFTICVVAATAFYARHSKALTAWYKSQIPDQLKGIFEAIVVGVEKDLGTSTGQEKFNAAVSRAQSALAAMGIVLPLTLIASGIEMAYQELVKYGVLSPAAKAQTTTTPTTG